MASFINSVTIAVPAITYKILYNENTESDNNDENSENKFIELNDNTTDNKFNTFKIILKELLEKRNEESKDKYIVSLLEIVKNDTNDTDKKIFTDKKLPFILSIEKNIGDKIESTLVILNITKDKDVFIDFWNTYNEKIDFGIFQGFNVEYYQKCKTGNNEDVINTSPVEDVINTSPVENVNNNDSNEDDNSENESLQ